MNITKINGLSIFMRNFRNENYYDFISEIISVVRVSFILEDSILFWVKVKLRLKANYIEK